MTFKMVRGDGVAVLERIGCPVLAEARKLAVAMPTGDYRETDSSGKAALPKWLTGTLRQG